MGKVDPKIRKEYMTRYRAKPGVRAAELEYARAYGKVLRSTPKGRAYTLFKSARARAREKKFEFDLDVDFILERINRGYCPILGLPFDLSGERDTWHHPCAPSLDRIDSAKGYTKDNVAVVSVWWNTAKSQWAPEFHKEAIRRAAEYFNRRFPWELTE